MKKLGAGDIGISASVSSTTNTVGIVWNVAPHLVLAPEVGFASWNDAITPFSGQSTTNYPGYWLHGALSVYYELNPFGKNLYLDIGPEVYYNTQPSYKTNGSNDNYTWQNIGVQLNVTPKVLLTNNFAVFTVLGLEYNSYDRKDTTTGYEYASTGFYLENLNLGVIFYFR